MEIKEKHMAHRKKFTNMVCCLGCAAVMAAGGAAGISGMTAVNVYAAQSSVIENVKVTFHSSWGDPEEILEPEITVSGSGVSLADVQFHTESDNWKPGKKVRAEINILADEGKHFPASLGSSRCKVSGASFVSAKALDDGTLQVKVDYTPVCVLGVPQEAGWSSVNPGKAVWKRVTYAPGYSLTLYGDDKVVKRMSVTDNSVDLSSYMDDPDKYYYYKVKAVPVTDSQKKYLKEGDEVLSEEETLDESWPEEPNCQSGGPDDAGSFKGDHYIHPDGSKAVNTWKMLNGKWYYFGADGNRSRGWVNYGGLWYYMNADGVMQTGWIAPGDGFWYYLKPEGEMVTGWIQPTPGIWYYLGGDGRMQTGWLLYNNNWYYMNAGGDMAVNTTIDGWIIGPDGIARKG